LGQKQLGMGSASCAQDKAIKSTLDLVQRAIDAQFKQGKENRDLFKKGSVERLNRIMIELGYKID
jgi:hypothetical protein